MSLRSSQNYQAPKNQLSAEEIQEMLRKKATSSLIRNPSRMNEKNLRQLQNQKSHENFKDIALSGNRGDREKSEKSSG